MNPIPQPDLSIVAELTRTELSLWGRLGHVLLVLVASATTIIVVSLWLTEPGLPARTRAAFALLTLIGLAWVAYGMWVLTTRRVMLARQRVVAGRLAVAFTGTFAIGCALLAVTAAAPNAAWPALVMSLVLLAVALVLWRRAEAALATLLARRHTLERELARGAQ